MKAQMMMLVGIGVLGSFGTARAQVAGTTPPNAVNPPLPTTNPDVTTPASPLAPVQPGVIPPLATPDQLPPPSPSPRAAVPPPPPPGYPVEGEANGYPVWMAKIGMAMMLGGGYEDFTQSGPKSVTNAGGSWNARLSAGTRQFVGLEAAYVGGARSFQVLGATTNTNLVNNGLEGTLRLNVPIGVGMSLIEPFGFAGVGWQHYTTSNSFTTASLSTSDDIMTVPYGAGLMYAYGMFMADARVTFRETYYNDLFRGSKLNTWGAGGNIGVEF